MLTRIGFIVTPGFRAADAIGPASILAVPPFAHRTYYVGPSTDVVRDARGLAVVPDVDFESCPPLDVLVVGELAEASLDDPVLLTFLAEASRRAAHLIGISNGVLALAKAGVLKHRRATADRQTLPRLAAYGVRPVERRRVVRDGHVFTAGPSTGAIEAAFMVLRELRGDFVTKLAELSLEYAPTLQHDREEVAVPPDDRPLRVGVLTAPQMYAPDVIGAVDTLGALPGAQMHYLWKSLEPAKSILGATLVPDTRLTECPQLDVIVLGLNMPGRCADPELLSFLREQASGVRAIVCICAGSLIVGAAGLLEDQVATSNFHMTGLLGACGARPAHTEVVSYGKFYSAGPAIGSYEAALMAVGDIYGPEAAAYLEREVLEYSPHPLFGVGTPERAGRFLTFCSMAAVGPSLPFFRAALGRGRELSRSLPTPREVAS